MKVIIDKEKCIGCGLCEQLAPDIYEMQGEVAVPKVEVIPDNKIEDAKNAAEQCPVEAITIA